MLIFQIKNITNLKDIPIVAKGVRKSSLKYHFIDSRWNKFKVVSLISEIIHKFYLKIFYIMKIFLLKKEIYRYRKCSRNIISYASHVYGP